MKKTIIFTLVTIILLSTFAACNPSQKDDASIPSDTSNGIGGAANSQSNTNRPGSIDTPSVENTRPNYSSTIDTSNNTNANDYDEPIDPPIEDNEPIDTPIDDEPDGPIDPSGEDSKEEDEPVDVPTSPSPTDTQINIETTSPQPETTDKTVENISPSINLGGKIINIVSRNHPWNIDEIKVETQTADPINDAVFKRTATVEKNLNITIKNTLIPCNTNNGTTENFVVIEELKKTNGPDCPYHLIANNVYTSFGNISEGYFRNLRDVSTLNLENNYWATYFNPEASIGNQQYVATGAASLTLRRFIFVTFFNKDLADHYDLENLYDVVKEGRWTLDYQANITSNMWTEEDGENGKTEGDSYGFITDDGLCVDVYVSACDLKILLKDSDDFYVLAPEKEKADKMISKINNLYWKSGATYVFARKGDYSHFDKMREKFAAGETTMITERLLAAESVILRNMEAPYGIIPIPKLDDSQKQYFSHAHDMFTVFGIVNSATTDSIVDDLGIVLESIAIESQNIVTPAYYEVALKGKYSKDSESWEMLDMIVENLKINGGVLYTTKLDNLTQKFRVAATEKKNDSSSIFNPVKLQVLQRALTAMQKEIKDFQNS